MRYIGHDEDLKIKCLHIMFDTTFSFYPDRVGKYSIHQTYMQFCNEPIDTLLYYTNLINHNPLPRHRLCILSVIYR